MIIPISTNYATQISQWTYENEYTIYSFQHNEDTMKELMNGEFYVSLDQYNELTGYFCFGKSAQIPTIEKEVYNPQILDIGLGMNPSLCGKGYGYVFVKSGLNFAQEKFGNKQIRLTVAAFNTRAIYLYEKLGFQHSFNVTHYNSKKVFQVMTYTY